MNICITIPPWSEVRLMHRRDVCFTRPATPAAPPLAGFLRMRLRSVERGVANL